MQVLLRMCQHRLSSMHSTCHKTLFPRLSWSQRWPGYKILANKKRAEGYWTSSFSFLYGIQFPICSFCFSACGMYMIPAHIATILSTNAIHQCWQSRKLERGQNFENFLELLHQFWTTSGFIQQGTNKVLIHLNYSSPVFLCLEPKALILMHITRSHYKGLAHNEYLAIYRTDVKSNFNSRAYPWHLPILSLLGASPGQHCEQ